MCLTEVMGGWGGEAACLETGGGRLGKPGSGMMEVVSGKNGGSVWGLADWRLCLEFGVLSR